MSIDCALIVRKDSLPTTAELASAIAGTGVVVAFPDDFRLDRNPNGWVQIEVDGEATGFDFGLDALTNLDAEIATDDLRQYGDTVLTFGARGALSAEAVSLIQRTLAGRWNAAGWIEQELILPSEMARDREPSADMDHDLAALMRGSPADRAAATEAWVAKHRPVVDPFSLSPPTPAEPDEPLLKRLVRDRFGLILLVIAVVVVALWTALN